MATITIQVIKEPSVENSLVETDKKDNKIQGQLTMALLYEAKTGRRIIDFIILWEKIWQGLIFY